MEERLWDDQSRAVPVPSHSESRCSHVGADLADAFVVHLPARASDDLEALARALFVAAGVGGPRADLGARCGDGDGRRQIVGAIGAAAAHAVAIADLPLLSKSAGTVVARTTASRFSEFANLLRTGAAVTRQLSLVATVADRQGAARAAYPRGDRAIHRTILRANGIGGADGG